MKMHLCTLFLAISLFSHTGHCAEPTEPRFLNTEITITIADATSKIDVAKSNGIEQPGNIKVYQSGFERSENDKSKGSVHYKFVKQTSKGDLYIFTVTHPDMKPEIINYIYTGTGDRFYGKDGITITIQQIPG